MKRCKTVCNYDNHSNVGDYTGVAALTPNDTLWDSTPGTFKAQRVAVALINSPSLPRQRGVKLLAFCWNAYIFQIQEIMHPHAYHRGHYEPLNTRFEGIPYGTWFSALPLQHVFAICMGGVPQKEAWFVGGLEIIYNYRDAFGVRCVCGYFSIFIRCTSRSSKWMWKYWSKKLFFTIQYQ